MYSIASILYIVAGQPGGDDHELRVEQRPGAKEHHGVAAEAIGHQGHGQDDEEVLLFYYVIYYTFYHNISNISYYLMLYRIMVYMRYYMLLYHIMLYHVI